MALGSFGVVVRRVIAPAEAEEAVSLSKTLVPKTVELARREAGCQCDTAEVGIGCRNESWRPGTSRASD